MVRLVYTQGSLLNQSTREKPNHVEAIEGIEDAVPIVVTAGVRHLSRV